jgi:hypothetical protein
MDIINNYRQQVAFAQQEADKYKIKANNYSLYRLVLFGFFILSICLAVAVDEIAIIAFALIILIACFSWLIKKQNGFELLKNYYLDLSITANTSMYYNGEVFNNDQHYYTSDLDIFGNNSLFQLINRCATQPGMIKLAGWLDKAADKKVILERQQAVDEIAAKSGWKLDFQANLLFSLKQQREQIKNLLAYLKLPVELKDQKALSLYSKAAPYLLVALLVVSYFYVPARYFILVLALFNNRLVSAQKEKVDKADLIAGRIGTTLAHFVLAFKSIENEQWESVYLKTISAKIAATGDQAVSNKIKELSILINKLNYRLNLVVKFVLNIFYLWDIRQLIAIETWKKNNHQSFETAFDVVAEFEAIISISSLRINYPDWVMPVIAEDTGYTLITKNLAHPLIKRERRVDNDYTLNDAFKIDIITGSNMAGKSTFLRTIGINTVLALSGAPVCASEMRVSVITIITYMRIKDSLNESTSTFKAELDRLQLLLKAVEGDNNVFFLIDEMLRGTNSVDKYLGSKAVIEQLIKRKAVGMVATHDLQIAELEAAHPEYVRNFYFDIKVKEGEMLFDYKIKAGECKTFNASLLLKQIGIDVNA